MSQPLRHVARSVAPVRRSRSFWVRAAAAVLGVALLAGCASANANTRRASASPDRVTVVGDSLTILGAAAIESALDTSGWLVTVASTPGHTAGDQLETLRSTAARHERATIVELGTNDALGVAHGRLSLDQARSNLLAALDATAGNCVVWVLPDADPERRGVGAGAQIADILRREADHRPDVHLADFGAVLAVHPELFVDDHVHLNGAGYQALADTMAAAVASCR